MLTLFLIVITLVSVPLYFFCDRALQRFRGNPDPRLAAAMRRYDMLMRWARIAFVLSPATIGFMIDWDRAAVATDDIVFTLLGFFGAIALQYPLHLLFGARSTPLPLESLPPDAGARLTFFAARSRCAGTILRYDYKVFIAPAMLCGAEVEDDVDDETGKFVRDFKKGFLFREAAFYDAVDVTSPMFCELNRLNFQIAWRDVASIECDPRPKWLGFTRFPSGRIIVRLKSGAARELILLGKRDARPLRDALQRVADRAA